MHWAYEAFLKADTVLNTSVLALAVAPYFPERNVSERTCIAVPDHFIHLRRLTPLTASQYLDVKPAITIPSFVRDILLKCLLLFWSKNAKSSSSFQFDYKYVVYTKEDGIQ
jgi:hypothetical protein